MATKVNTELKLAGKRIGGERQGHLTSLAHLKEKEKKLRALMSIASSQKKPDKKMVKDAANWGTELIETIERIESISDQIREIQKKQANTAMPGEIMMIIGPNRSGKTRFLQILKGWFGDRAGYYSGSLPHGAVEDYLLLDEPFQNADAPGTMKRIERTAKGRKVILAIIEVPKFQFSKKTQVHILKINGLETWPDSRSQYIEDKMSIR